MRTIVLIHGSWLGGWCWSDVASELRRRGFRVLAPTLTGLGDRAHLATRDISLALHIEDVVQACRLEGVESPVLVGHSYGAVVATGVAAREELSPAQLQLIDGFLLQPGETIFGAYPDAHALLAPLIRDDGFMDVPPLDLFAIENPAVAAGLLRNMRRMPVAPNLQPLAFSAARIAALPRAYLRFSEFPAFAATVPRAAQEGWEVAEMAAGHMAIVTHPAEVASRIAERAAR